MFHRFAALVLALCASVGILGPMAAQAIPVAGDYIISSPGDRPFTGTFTSNGSSLTVWEITAPLGDPPGYLWTSAPTTPTQVVETNDADTFWVSTHIRGFEIPSNLIIHWESSNVFANLIFGDPFSGHFLELMVMPPFTVQSVPEGGLQGEVAFGLFFLLLASTWWPRRQAEL